MNFNWYRNIPPYCMIQKYFHSLFSHVFQVPHFACSKAITVPRKQLNFYDVIQEFISILFCFSILLVMEMFAKQAFKCAVLFKTAARRGCSSLLTFSLYFSLESKYLPLYVFRGTALGKFRLPGFAKGGLKCVPAAPQLSNSKQEVLTPERLMHEILP